MTIDRSTVQLFLFILLAVFSAFLLRAAISVNKEREKERVERKNKELGITESLHDLHAK